MGTPAAAPTPASATSPCKIINNTNYDVIVLSPNGIGNPDTVYKTTNGSSIIPKNASASLNLDPTQLYNLIVCTGGSLFPIANLAVSSDLTTNLFADVKVAQSDYVAMTNAANFQQAIMAVPESSMASSYTAAVTKAAATPDVTTGDQVMSAFFQSTSGYKEVTADEVTAIVTYYNSFPVVWAEASPSVTYYLYSSNGTANSFNGTVKFSLAGALDITKPNCGYSCVFTAAKNPSDMTSTAVDPSKTKSLTYSAGLFTDNADVPTISLGGSFQLESKLTQDPTDSTIITTLSGKLGATTVLGFDKPQTTAAAASDPPSWEDIISQIFTGLNDLLTVMFLGQLAFGAGKFIKKKYDASQEKNLPPEERAKKLQEDLDTAKKNLEDHNAKNAAKMKVKPQTDTKSAMDDASNSSETVDAIGKKVQLKEVTVKQADSLEKLAPEEGEFTESEISDLNASEESIRDSFKVLNTKTDPATVKQVVADQTPKVQDTHEKIGSLTESTNIRLSTATKTAITDSQVVNEKTMNDIEKVNDQVKEVEEGGIKSKNADDVGDIADAGKVLEDVPKL